jgi:glycosyltransferase involved in cell wall biosynthesis
VTGPLRIAHLATFLQGGAGRAIVNLARQQQQSGHDVSVVVSRRGAPGYGNYEAYLDELTKAGVRVQLVDSMFERNHALNVAVVAALGRLYPAGHAPHVMHTHAAIPTLVALLFAGARRAPIALLQTMHGWGQMKTSDQVATDISLIDLVDRVVVPSQHSAGVLLSLGVAPSRVAVIPYGIHPELQDLDDDDRETLHAMTRARRAGALVVACVGTIGERKNQGLLVDAVSRVSESQVKCVFIGDGDDTHLKSAAERTGCVDRFRFHGYSRAARTLAAGADLLVLPSRSEGQPISAIEAFCDGTLVAVSDIPELVELVSPGSTGFTFRSDDAESLAALLGDVARLSNSSRRRVRETARLHYASHFALERMTDGYALLYRSLCDAARAAAARPSISAA